MGVIIKGFGNLGLVIGDGVIVAVEVARFNFTLFVAHDSKKVEMKGNVKPDSF